MSTLPTRPIAAGRGPKSALGWCGVVDTSGGDGAPGAAAPVRPLTRRAEEGANEASDGALWVVITVHNKYTVICILRVHDTISYFCIYFALMLENC